jgi:hypothetical protein
MIRCRRCNAELIEQTHLCNVCGLPQKPSEPELGKTTPTKQKTPNLYSTNRCVNCATQLPDEAHFCAVCGVTQTAQKSSVIQTTYGEQVKSASTSENHESSTVYSQPSMSLKPSRSIQPINKQLSIESDHLPNPPVYPTRPTTSDSVKRESISNIQTHTPGELAAPAHSPGLIPPVTPKSPTHSAISSRPDSAGLTLSTQQSRQIPQVPAYSIPIPPTKVPLSTKQQAQLHSGSSYTQPNSQQQIADLATRQHQAYSQYPQQKVNGNSTPNHPQEQNAGVQITPVASSWQKSPRYDIDVIPTSGLSTEYDNRKNVMTDSPKMDLLRPASFIATSKAAERWRKSWRDRQYAEVGPAENPSRGQASVAMPLMTMQHSFARMRAMESHDAKQQGKSLVSFGTWITIFLMICLIIGLGTYIFVSYLPNSPHGVTSVTSPTNTTQPTLALVGTESQNVKIGQSIQLHGKQFGANQTIIFLSDTAAPVVDTSGKNITTQTDNQGAFAITIPIDSQWGTGSHSIEAVDNKTSQNAFLTIQVIPAGIPTTTSTNLSISMDGTPTTLLKFKAVIGQGNSVPQHITITNTSGSPLEWNAMTSTNNNLNWLMINDNNTLGQLASSQPHDMIISVNTVGLKSTPKTPYLGQILFTINNNQMLTLPVQLQIIDATPEMVFSPNPIIAQIGPGNTCQPGVTLTLINLGTASISWSVNPDDNIKGNIQFVNNGQLKESGILLPSGSTLPSGQPGDTVVLTLQCNSIQIGHSYHVSVYANQMSWSEGVIVRQQP